MGIVIGGRVERISGTANPTDLKTNRRVSALRCEWSIAHCSAPNHLFARPLQLSECVLIAQPHRIRFCPLNLFSVSDAVYLLNTRLFESGVTGVKTGFKWLTLLYVSKCRPRHSCNTPTLVEPLGQ